MSEATLPGISPDETLEVQPELREDGLPYISKSRLTTYIKCPAKFYWKYWCGHRTPDTIHTEKGSRLHEAFEDFHRNLAAYVEAHGERPARFTDLLPHYRQWAQWIEQVGAFFAFEERRWQATSEALYGKPYFTGWDEWVLDHWLPIEVEAEAWLGDPPQSWVDEHGEPDYVSGEPPVGDAPWMGFADAILDSRSVPGVEGDGVTILDYKTGSCPTIRYAGHDLLDTILNEGIFLEGEYYGWLFEAFYDVDAVAGYYPGDDELVVSPYPNQERRRDIKRCVIGMQREPEETEGNALPTEYPYEEQPLCNYSSGNCHFYNICPSTW